MADQEEEAGCQASSNGKLGRLTPQGQTSIDGNQAPIPINPMYPARVLSTEDQVMTVRDDHSSNILISEHAHDVISQGEESLRVVTAEAAKLRQQMRNFDNMMTQHSQNVEEIHQRQQYMEQQSSAEKAARITGSNWVKSQASSPDRSSQKPVSKEQALRMLLQSDENGENYGYSDLIKQNVTVMTGNRRQSHSHANTMPAIRLGTTGPIYRRGTLPPIESHQDLPQATDRMNQTLAVSKEPEIVDGNFFHQGALKLHSDGGDANSMFDSAQMPNYRPNYTAQEGFHKRLPKLQTFVKQPRHSENQTIQLQQSEDRRDAKGGRNATGTADNSALFEVKEFGNRRGPIKANHDSRVLLPGIKHKFKQRNSIDAQHSTTRKLESINLNSEKAWTTEKKSIEHAEQSKFKRHATVEPKMRREGIEMESSLSHTMLAFAAQNDSTSLHLMFHTDEHMQRLNRLNEDDACSLLMQRLYTIQRSSSRSDKANAMFKGKLLSQGFQCLKPQRAKHQEDFFREQDRILSALKRSINLKQYNKALKLAQKGVEQQRNPEDVIKDLAERLRSRTGTLQLVMKPKLPVRTTNTNLRAARKAREQEEEEKRRQELMIGGKSSPSSSPKRSLLSLTGGLSRRSRFQTQKASADARCSNVTLMGPEVLPAGGDGKGLQSSRNLNKPTVRFKLYGKNSSLYEEKNKWATPQVPRQLSNRKFVNEEDHEKEQSKKQLKAMRAAASMKLASDQDQRQSTNADLFDIKEDGRSSHLSDQKQIDLRTASPLKSYQNGIELDQKSNDEEQDKKEAKNPSIDEMAHSIFSELHSAPLYDSQKGEDKPLPENDINQIQKQSTNQRATPSEETHGVSNQLARRPSTMMEHFFKLEDSKVNSHGSLAPTGSDHAKNEEDFIPVRDQRFEDSAEHLSQTVVQDEERSHQPICSQSTSQYGTTYNATHGARQLNDLLKSHSHLYSKASLTRTEIFNKSERLNEHHSIYTSQRTRGHKKPAKMFSSSLRTSQQNPQSDEETIKTRIVESSLMKGRNDLGENDILTKLFTQPPDSNILLQIMSCLEMDELKQIPLISRVAHEILTPTDGSQSYTNKRFFQNFIELRFPQCIADFNMLELVERTFYSIRSFPVMLRFIEHFLAREVQPALKNQFLTVERMLTSLSTTLSHKKHRPSRKAKRSKAAAALKRKQSKRYAHGTHNGARGKQTYERLNEDSRIELLGYCGYSAENATKGFNDLGFFQERKSLRESLLGLPALRKVPFDITVEKIPGFWLKLSCKVYYGLFASFQNSSQSFQIELTAQKMSSYREKDRDSSWKIVENLVWSPQEATEIHTLTQDDLVEVKIPKELRGEEEYCLRFSVTSAQDKIVDPIVAFEAFGIADCTDEMTEEPEDHLNYVAFSDHAAITNCESEISYATMKMVAQDSCHLLKKVSNQEVVQEDAQVSEEKIEILRGSATVESEFSLSNLEKVLSRNGYDVLQFFTLIDLSYLSKVNRHCYGILDPEQTESCIRYSTLLNRQSYVVQELPQLWEVLVDKAQDQEPRSFLKVMVTVIELLKFQDETERLQQEKLEEAERQQLKQIAQVEAEEQAKRHSSPLAIVEEEPGDNRKVQTRQEELPPTTSQDEPRKLRKVKTSRTSKDILFRGGRKVRVIPITEHDWHSKSITKHKDCDADDSCWGCRD